VNVDKDEGGIYKAWPGQQQHHQNAATVADDRHMVVDMPADYRKPNQVIHVLDVVKLCLYLF
jgi:hypothetical protein